MLYHEILLAKIRVDTAENDPLEVWGEIIQYYLFVSLVAMRSAVRGSVPFLEHWTGSAQRNIIVPF